MIKYLSAPERENTFRDRLNTSLMTKQWDEPLVEYIKDCWRSLEVVKNFKILKFEYNTDESNLDINKYILKRNKKKKKKEIFDIKHINDDRFNVLTTWIEITHKYNDPKTLEEIVSKKVIKKNMIIPVIDEDGFMYIKGKRYRLIYQLVERSTYTTNQSITLKSLMPIVVKRVPIEEEEDRFYKEDEEPIVHTLPKYNTFVFRKEMPIMLFYAANGLEAAIDTLNVSEAIKFRPYECERDNEKFIYFKMSNKVVLEVYRNLFEKYTFVQACCGMLLDLKNNRLDMDTINDGQYWIKKLGNNNYDKGFDLLMFFRRMLDETTKKILNLPSYHKDNIYSLLRWMMQNFNTLRSKDNASLLNKRLRCNEYIASLLTMQFSRRINRVMSLGNNATMQDFIDCFKFGGNILLQQMHSSGILRFDETINDMDFFKKFRYTIKGPHSIGGKNDNTRGIKDRGLHYSFLGYIDVLVCGNSD